MARSPPVVLAVFVIAVLVAARAFPSTSSLTSPATSPSTFPSPPPSTPVPSAPAQETFRAAFTVPASADQGQQVLPNIYDPEAADAQSVCPGYKALNVVTTSRALTADLVLAGAPCNVYGNEIPALKLVVEHQSSDRLHVEITPAYIGPHNHSWFALPDALIPRPVVDPDPVSRRDRQLEFTWSNDPSFSFTIRRTLTGDSLFSTKGTKLVFEDQFIEFASALPANYNLYGLGEVIHGLRMGNNFTRTFWAADVPDPVDMNIYGTHPFYLDTRYYAVGDDGNLAYAPGATDATKKYKSFSHGVYLRNSHGQEVLMRPENITWRTLGGSIDLYIYAGPTQKDVTRAYQRSAVGLPAMQQYFTFGLHQCRWGYQNWSVVEEVVDNFAKFDIPLENIWTDIDYMYQYRDFENDPVRFGYEEGSRFLSKLHRNGQHFIPIVDSAVYIPNPTNISDAYPTFDRGNATNSFMLNPDGSLYVGAVWPGYTVFPDWIGAVLSDGGAFDWWADEIERWHQNISFDGIWIDMSEVASFCVGSCGSANVTLNPVHPPFSLPGEPGNIIYDYPEGFTSTNAVVATTQITQSPAPTTTQYLRTKPTPGTRNINYPPYVINNVHGDLAVHAVSPNATHRGGGVEYEYHNLFGHQILNATYHALLRISPTKRPFIIGRSTFPGSGKWAGHWGGDNVSQFLYMAMSIPQALSFSLFGIPMFGVDTCGFGGNTDEELCNRWMQLSAFFPFYRNHNILSAIPQEPYRWASVIQATKQATTIRYTLLPYIYTAFYLAHTTGSTVMRALAWEFPDDPTLANADRQFLLGGSLMVTPVLNQGALTVNGVFPGTADNEVWYDWYNQSVVTVNPGQNITIDAPLGHIPVYLRGGTVFPIQEPGMTTKACRSNPWGLLVSLSKDGSAAGNLYVDDGESLKPNATLWVDVRSL